MKCGNIGSVTETCCSRCLKLCQRNGSQVGTRNTEAVALSRVFHFRSTDLGIYSSSGLCSHESHRMKDQCVAENGMQSRPQEWLKLMATESRSQWISSKIVACLR